MPRDKTVTRTFSMRKDLVEALEKEARSRGISTSALMNQTIERIVRQVWPSEKTGVIVIGHYVIKDLLDHMSPEDLRKIAALSAQRHKARASILYGTEQRLESVLEMMDKVTGPYFGWFTFTHSDKGRDHRILLYHSMGIGWSIWLEAYFVSFFMEMLEIPVKSSYTESNVVLEFRA
ncbi:hypothetical protein A3K78_05035 [Candidatus Bathyarchaeota archaeon RBG_13_52_12]|nr:MAG: hypothetical protein A3K78_05035 [Candidatus Bathyarchaeota archaeon RBG_13_52_12]